MRRIEGGDMLFGSLSEIDKSDITKLLGAAVEDVELEFKRALNCSKGADPWMTGGKIGDRAKSALAEEMIAFANTIGGVLVLGLEEDAATKQATTIHPIPKCVQAAEALHSSITEKIEPKLPLFECVGVPTEEDGSSGVIVMRTLESYLAPHRHADNRQCYIRRNDRSEPMSMPEIRDQVIRSAGRMESIDREFAKSGEAFWYWIPEGSKNTHPGLNIAGKHVPNADGYSYWQGAWALRLTAIPLVPLHLAELPRQPWLAKLSPSQYRGPGKQRCLDIQFNSASIWQPALRSVRRNISGECFEAYDSLTVNGSATRFVLGEHKNTKSDARTVRFAIRELIWNMAELLRAIDAIRSSANRPSQPYGIEVELTSSDNLFLTGYDGLSPDDDQIIPGGRIVFPRYEAQGRDGFNELLTVFDRDIWHAAGYDPDWELAIDWPSPET